MDYTEKNKERVLTSLRKLCQREKWRVLLSRAAKVDGSPKPFVTQSTVARMLEDDYNIQDMRERSFEQIVWLLKYHNALEAHESMEESANQFGLSLKQFINPEASSNRRFSDGLVGQYQGYRWSNSNPRTLALFRLVIVYDQKNDVLITEEIGYDPSTKMQEVLEGTLAINPDSQDNGYIVARKKIDSAITSLQFTITCSYQRDSSGKVTEMSGVIFGHTSGGPFVRNVLLNRHHSPEIRCIVPNSEHSQIEAALDKIKIDTVSQIRLLGSGTFVPAFDARNPIPSKKSPFSH